MLRINHPENVISSENVISYIFGPPLKGLEATLSHKSKSESLAIYPGNILLPHAGVSESSSANFCEAWQLLEMESLPRFQQGGEVAAGHPVVFFGGLHSLFFRDILYAQP